MKPLGRWAAPPIPAFASRPSFHGRVKLARPTIPKSGRLVAWGAWAIGNLTNGRTPSDGRADRDEPARRGLHGSTARVAPPELLPERRLLPSGLTEPLPLRVEVRVRKQDRDHLLAAPVPEPEPPRRGRTRSPFGLEEGGPGHTADPCELRAARAAMIVDAEVEVPGAAIDREVSVELRDPGRRRELDLVGRALDQRTRGELGPVLGEELDEQSLDLVTGDGHIVILGRRPVEAMLDRGRRAFAHARLPVVVGSVSILLQVEDHRQPDPQRSGCETLGEWLGRETAHGFQRGLVEHGMRRRARDRDAADRPIGLDEDLEQDGARETSTARGRRVPERFQEAPSHGRQVATVLRSRRAAPRPPARRHSGAPGSALVLARRTGARRRSTAG